MYIMLPKQMNQDRKSNINGVIGLNVNKDAEIMVPLNHFQHYQTKKSKRFRSAFTTEQINHLEKEFKRFPYIGSANRKEVANALSISERAVKIWFQNRRMKEKKENNNKEFIANQNNINIEFANGQLNNVRDLQPHYGVHGCIKQSTQISNNDCSNVLNTQLGNENNLFKTCMASQNKTEVNNDATTSQRNFNYETTLQKEKISRFTNTTQVRKDTKTVPVLPPSQGTFSYLDNLDKESKRNNKDIKRQNQQVFETPQDLSSKTRLLDKPPLKNQQFIPAIDSSQEYVSMYTDSYCTTPLPHPAAVTRFPDQMVSSVRPGNIIWKPVNMMPSGLASVALPHSNGFPVFNHIPKGDCNCNCNCHGSSQGLYPGFTQDTRTQPQYIIAIPVRNNACNKM